MWIDYDTGADRLLVNTARGRRKERNVRENPKVGLSMTDPDDGYRYVSVGGEVTELREAGTADHIDGLARRYMDAEEYPHHGDECGPRVRMRVRSDRVMTSGEESD